MKALGNPWGIPNAEMPIATNGQKEAKGDWERSGAGRVDSVQAERAVRFLVVHGSGMSVCGQLLVSCNGLPLFSLEFFSFSFFHNK